MDDFSDFNGDSLNSSITGKQRQGTVVQMGGMVPNAPKLSEAQILKPLISQSDAESAASNNFESGPQNLSVLRDAIAEQKNPAIKKVLSDHYTQLSNKNPTDDFPDFTSDSIHADVSKLPADKPAPVPGEAVPDTVAQTLAKVLPIPGVKLASMLSQETGQNAMNEPLNTNPAIDAAKLFAKSGIALGDTVANGVGGFVKQAEYAGLRALGKSPDEATNQASTGVGSLLENPFSKFANAANNLVTGSTAKVEDSPEYKGESSQKIMKFVGDNIGKGAGWISQQTGAPKADVENAMNTALLGVAPAISKYGKQAILKASSAVDAFGQELSGKRPLSDLLDAGKPANNSDIVPPVAKPAYKLVNGKPVLIPQDMSIPAITPAIDSARPVGSALSVPPETPPPLAPAVEMPTTAQSIKQTAENNPASLFPEIPTHAPRGTQFSPAEQLARAQAMVAVGVNPLRLRKSAVTGDHLSGATDHQTSLVDSPAGRVMSNDLEQEKAAISNSALQISRDAGGTTGLAQNDLVRRGNTIIEPIDKFREYLDDKTSELYKQKDAIAKGVPTDLTSVVDELNKKSNVTTTQDAILKRSVRAYADEIGMLKPDGSISGSVLDAEKLRKHLNASYTYENSGINIKLKNAIDNDTFTPEDGLIYKDARALREYRANTLDNPEGISKLAESSGPNDINRAVQIERIPDNVAGMSVAQFDHVIDTLRGMPPELAASAGKSLAEIKSQFANLYHKAGTSQMGQWNTKGATAFLQNNASRMATLFTPEEMAQFRKINDAGQIMAKGQSYPGAAAQKHNLVTAGLIGGAATAGLGIGNFIADAPGSVVGGIIGKEVGQRMGDAAAVRAVNKRMVKLSDLVKNK